jgi:hypothetical protein
MNRAIKKQIRKWMVDFAAETDPARRQELLEEASLIAERVRQAHGGGFPEAFQMLARAQHVNPEPIVVMATRFAMVVELLR